MKKLEEITISRLDLDFILEVFQMSPVKDRAAFIEAIFSSYHVLDEAVSIAKGEACSGV